ncbi:MAG: hypothetical protein AB7N65_11935, partial [Vicinamibacterales bacterium]
MKPWRDLSVDSTPGARAGARVGHPTWRLSAADLDIPGVGYPTPLRGRGARSPMGRSANVNRGSTTDRRQFLGHM